MNPDESKYLRACSRNGLIIDTNLLIALLVGSYDSDLISLCCSGCNIDTFVFLKRLLALTKATIVVTPNILTEVHNLTFHEIKQPKLSLYVNKLIEIVMLTREEHTEKTLLLGNANMLTAFGFTDLSILEAAKKCDCAVISDDHRLVTALMTARCHARSIDSVRPMVPA